MSNTKAGLGTGPSKATATNVSITLDLSEDGATVAKISIHIGEEKFEVKTSGSVSTGTSSGETQYLNGPFPIIKGNFKTPEAAGRTSVTGRRISAKRSPRVGAYSGRCRSPFRADGDHDSGMMPIRIPG